jgi:hypothetical protein
VPKDYTGICADLAEFLDDRQNGKLVGDRALAINGGTWTNACVITASEALRQLDCDIPRSTDHTTELIRDLSRRGFVKSQDFAAIQPGAVCFTTDANGKVGNNPTHTFIFLSWVEEGVMWIYDNQVSDYGSQYHERRLERHQLNDKPSSVKDATAYYYYR